jgi:hypothetical protein
VRAALAKSGLRHGFKAHAERIASELRTELHLGPVAPLDPQCLAEHLCVPVLTLHDLAQAAPDDVRHLLGHRRDLFSAVTIYRGRRRLIVTNPAHAEARQTNSLCHELSHIVLDHEPEGPLLNVSSGRDWDGTQEHEANWLAGWLLIPDAAAYRAARAQRTDDEIATAYGVSLALAMWRMRMTGARLRVQRAHDARPSFR